MLKSLSDTLFSASICAMCVVAVGAAALSADGSASDDPHLIDDGTGLRGFVSESGLDDFAEKMVALEEEQRRRYESSGQVVYSVNVDMAAPPPAAEMAGGVEEVADASAPAEGESITNTQEAGVDEGGIVKNAGDYLVVLRRGRLFTVRTGSNALEPVDTIDAFPPGKERPGATWYDEMLIRGNQVIVIGYSYGAFGTEINRFDISDSGDLTYRDTHYMRSGDYYSSSNYASRLIGDELILYTPVYANWSNLEGSLPAMREFGESEAKVLVDPEDFLVATPYRSGKFHVDMLHTVTRCDLAAAELECSATAIAGTRSRAFYVSREAVYTWTGSAASSWEGDAERTPGQLYRIPLDGSRPGAVQVAGAPVDQFSFAEDASDGVLRVLLRSVGNGEGMWASEYSVGDVSLATVSFDAFGSGGGALVRENYRALPEPEGWRFHNRFVGDYLLYAAAWYGREDETLTVYAVPLDGREVQQIALPHGVTRFDRMGDDGVVVGPSGDGSLGFTSLSLGRRASIEDTYMLAAASEGETRSQALFYKPDADSRDGLSGTLGLPISRRLERNGSEFLGSGSAIAFLRRENRSLGRAGELAARSANARDDSCIASCVDWYGNARPIFLGDRIFALMGYEIVEGDMSDGRIRESRRVSFAP
ncbi:beta-propeller domain-containing protein [uncultured Erythrobacter sp.]|uniref:beta-propeller domain-containing protein n=1 Tax=uncultured Erythrobacter sp. TaxID=263913 RepID=UPI0026122009|nr:beta-propeller domain-containing protein [uncultured Erythrobacter sp.]